MGQNQLINYNLEPICQATVINTLSGLPLNTRLWANTSVHVSWGNTNKWQVLYILWWNITMKIGVIMKEGRISALRESPSGSDLYIPESIVKPTVRSGRRLVTCSFPSLPACKVIETAVWCRCQGHYQRKGLPAVAPSRRKLPTHPNKEKHKCTCCCLWGECDKMTL